MTKENKNSPAAAGEVEPFDVVEFCGRYGLRLVEFKQVSKEGVPADRWAVTIAASDSVGAVTIPHEVTFQFWRALKAHDASRMEQLEIEPREMVEQMRTIGGGREETDRLDHLDRIAAR